MDPGIARSSLLGQLYFTLRASPIHFLLLQLPQSLSELGENLFPSFFDEHRLVAFFVMLPLWALTSALAMALTYVSVRDSITVGAPSLKNSWDEVSQKIFPLLTAYILAGLVIALGFLSLILPAFYYLALYLFVPLVVIDEPKLPLSVYLLRSKKIAKASLKRTLALTLCLLFFGLFLAVLEGVLNEISGQLFASVAVRNITFLTANLFLSLVAGATMSVGVSHYYLRLKARSKT